MKTHYTLKELPENATVGQIMMRKTYCGVKTTFTAHPYMTTVVEHVDCQRCLDKIAAKEARIAARAAK